MSPVTIQMDFEITEGLVELYAKMTAAPFIGYDTPLNHEASLSSLQRYARTRRYGKFTRLAIMKIYHDGVLAGMAFPRQLERSEFRAFQIQYLDENDWYRLGTIFIAHEYRGKGIVADVIKEYRKTYPNLVWMCEAKNIASRKAALNGGLIQQPNLYFRSDDEWSFDRDKEFCYPYCIFKSGE